MSRPFSNGATFFKKRADQLVAPRRCHDISDGRAHETGDAGQCGEEDPLLPHLLHDMVAEAGVKAGIAQNACDTMNAFGHRAVALTKGELVNVVEVDNSTLRIERRCDDTLTAKNEGSSESLVQHVKVSHTIEQRQHHAWSRVQLPPRRSPLPPQDRRPCNSTGRGRRGDRYSLRGLLGA